MIKYPRIPLTIIASLFLSSLVNAQGLPEFALKCRDWSNQNSYRLASDGNEIYFASMDRRLSFVDLKKSTYYSVEPRSINMSLQDTSFIEKRLPMALDEDNGSQVLGTLARDTLALRIGKHQYSCEKIMEPEMFLTLKSAYEKSVLETIEKQRIYINRPNQL